MASPVAEQQQLIAQVRELLVRSDDVVKAAATRPDPIGSRERAARLLDEARALVEQLADTDQRRALAGQVARRIGELDRAAIGAMLVESPEVRRAPTQVDDPSRVPPGQHLTPGWPVLHVGAAPQLTWAQVRVVVTGRVRTRIVLDAEAFGRLPVVTRTADMHCVTGWSRLDQTWEGVRAADVLALADPRPEATHVVVSGHPAYSANLPLPALLDDEVLLAWACDGEPLTATHGGPLRLVVPSRYAWKSVKWVTELRLTDRDIPGYWEERGYHDDADPWREQRFR